MVITGGEHFNKPNPMHSRATLQKVTFVKASWSSSWHFNPIPNLPPFTLVPSDRQMQDILVFPNQPRLYLTTAKSSVELCKCSGEEESLALAFHISHYSEFQAKEITDLVLFAREQKLLFIIGSPTNVQLDLTGVQIQKQDEKHGS